MMVPIAKTAASNGSTWFALPSIKRCIPAKTSVDDYTLTDISNIYEQLLKARKDAGGSSTTILYIADAYCADTVTPAPFYLRCSDSNVPNFNLATLDLTALYADDTRTPAMVREFFLNFLGLRTGEPVTFNKTFTAKFDQLSGADAGGCAFTVTNFSNSEDNFTTQAIGSCANYNYFFKRLDRGSDTRPVIQLFFESETVNNNRKFIVPQDSMDFHYWQISPLKDQDVSAISEPIAREVQGSVSTYFVSR